MFCELLMLLADRRVTEQCASPSCKEQPLSLYSVQVHVVAPDSPDRLTLFVLVATDWHVVSGALFAL